MPVSLLSRSQHSTKFEATCYLIFYFDNDNDAAAANDDGGGSGAMVVVTYVDDGCGSNRDGMMVGC